MIKPCNLVTRLYKAEYFPKCGFLNSVIGHNLGYAWWSILSLKFVVRGRHKWSIGSRENISVWSENWFYDIISLNNPCLTNLIMDNLKILDPLVSNAKQWNSNLIHTMVGGREVAKVLNTQLFEVVREDKLAWKVFSA